jgi:hypothetical protein
MRGSGAGRPSVRAPGVTAVTLVAEDREDFVTYEDFYDDSRKKSSQVENSSG